MASEEKMVELITEIIGRYDGSDEFEMYGSSSDVVREILDLFYGLMGMG